MDIVWQNPSNPPLRSDYIFREGRRHVKPYYFEFICHVKNRWAGKTIVELFADEFKGRTHDYYVRAVKCGRIKVDGQSVTIYYRVKASQKISHFLHRHEPPVLAWDVSVLQEEEEVVTVYKPASVPVHPCGQYRKNTVVSILEAEHGLTPLFPIHRLDRLVSGLLILARSATKADSFRQQITSVPTPYSWQFFVACQLFLLSAAYASLEFAQKSNLPTTFRTFSEHWRSQETLWPSQIEAGLIIKQYIAKVVGVFPDGELVVDANVNYNAREGKSTVEVREGSSDKSLKGKTACTKFKRVYTNGNYSIVLCEPVTGRTHQIRVHLQHASHPIANDVLYLTDKVSYRSLEGTTADRAAANMANSPPSPADESISGYQEDHAEDFGVDPMCTNCPNLVPKGYDAHEEALWLHCVKYTGPGWTYECPYPEWATLD